MIKLLQNQLAKEIIVSLAILIAYQFLLKIPLPFLDMASLSSWSGKLGSEFLGDNFFENFSITSLGLMPFISSCLIIEISSLFVPFLKRHRNGNYSGRIVLKKYALILTFFISVTQSISIIHGLESMVSPSGLPILEISNPLQFIAIVSTQVASVYFILYLAELVTKHGIGNGISLLILSGSCLGLLGNVSRFFYQTNNIQQNFFYVMVFAVIFLLLSIFIPIYLLRSSYAIPLIHNTDNFFTNYFKLSSCLSGKEAIGYASTLLMLPATFISFGGYFETSVWLLLPGTLSYYVGLCVMVLLLSYVLGWLFIYPKKRFRTLEQWGWKTNIRTIDQAIKQKFLYLNLPWSLFLCGIVILPSIVITGFDIPFYLGGSSIFIIAFLCLDILSRIKLWKSNVMVKTFKIAEFHDVHHATMIKNHLNHLNINFYLQGYYHRHLLYFFGPYIPINLMIPSFEKDRVSEIINRYYGGLGLVEK